MRSLRVVAAVAVAGCLAALTEPARASCVVPDFRFYHDQESTAGMTVTSGGGCTVVVHAGAVSRFDRVAIVSRPQHGSVSAGSVGVRYQAAKNFKGTDSFTFSVTGDLGTGNATARIKVLINVI